MLESKIYFVILHYLTIDDTIECVESIQSLNGGENVEIIIVDNNSPNGTGMVMKNKYINNQHIEVVLLEKNEGFARGNNCGYQIAKKGNAEFIIIINNDIIIKQKDFLEVVVDKYNKRPYHIMGPNIVDLDGGHQNPHRLEGFGIKDVKRIIRNRTIILTYLKLVKLLKCTERIKLLSRLEQAHSQSEQKDMVWNKEQDNVVLQGSSYIFSKDYIEENDNAFYPGTFMYLEEEILFHIATEKKYIIRYTPDITVTHKTQVATISANTTSYAKSRTQTEWTLASAKVMKELLKSKNY